MDNRQSEQLDPDSFADSFERARPTLRIVAAAECGFQSADDAVQHGAVIALEQLHTFIPGSNFTAWTAAIVRGVARNQRRSDQRRSRHRPRIARFLLPRQTTQPHNPEHLRLRPAGSTPDIQLPKGLDSALREALETLTPQQRSCLLLKSLLNYTYSEIGSILDIPSSTARSHAYRARARLLDLLEHLEGGAR